MAFKRRKVVKASTRARARKTWRGAKWVNYKIFPALDWNTKTVVKGRRRLAPGRKRRTRRGGLIITDM